MQDSRVLLPVDLGEEGWMFFLLTGGGQEVVMRPGFYALATCLSRDF